MAYYRKSVYGDSKALAPNLREADKEEVWASHGLTPLQALQYSFLFSEECNTIIDYNEDIIGMFGVTSHGSFGVPWMLASDGLYEKRFVRKFIPTSKVWVNEIQQRYPLLINYVAQDNDRAIKWLRLLGFTFIKLEEQYGVNPKPFYEFVRIRS